MINSPFVHSKAKCKKWVEVVFGHKRLFTRKPLTTIRILLLVITGPQMQATSANADKYCTIF